MQVELSIPKVGERVKFVNNYYYDPQQRLAAGAMGTVVFVENTGDDYRIVIKVDNAPVDFDDGCMSFYPECGPETHPNGFEMGPLMQFHHYCQFDPAYIDHEIV